jgi:hypothetical protein
VNFYTLQTAKTAPIIGIFLREPDQVRCKKIHKCNRPLNQWLFRLPPGQKDHGYTPFNPLTVTGIAGAFHPTSFEIYLLTIGLWPGLVKAPRCLTKKVTEKRPCPGKRVFLHIRAKIPQARPAAGAPSRGLRSKLRSNSALRNCPAPGYTLNKRNNIMYLTPRVPQSCRYPPFFPDNTAFFLDFTPESLDFTSKSLDFTSKFSGFNHKSTTNSSS